MSDLAMTNNDERGTITHELKTWQSYFHALADGTKTFEIRKDDRDFRVGDALWLRETFYHNGEYTGREQRRKITSILRHEPEFGLMPGFAILSLDQSRSTVDAAVVERAARALFDNFVAQGEYVGRYGFSDGVFDLHAAVGAALEAALNPQEKTWR